MDALLSKSATLEMKEVKTVLGVQNIKRVLKMPEEASK